MLASSVRIPGLLTLRDSSPSRSQQVTPNAGVIVMANPNSKAKSPTQRAASERAREAQVRARQRRTWQRNEAYGGMKMDGVVACYPVTIVDMQLAKTGELMSFLTRRGAALAERGTKVGLRFDVDRFGQGWLLLSVHRPGSR